MLGRSAALLLALLAVGHATDSIKQNENGGADAQLVQLTLQGSALEVDGESENTSSNGDDTAQVSKQAPVPMVTCLAWPRHGGTGGWHRPFGNVPISAAGANICQTKCANAGYKYFGLECPFGSGVICQCSNALGGTAKGPEYCEGKGNPLVHAHQHCVGPYFKEGYRFGDYVVSSVYETQPQDPTPAPTAAPTAAPTQAPTSAPTPTPTGNVVKAKGDPHLMNIYGQKFDLMQPGEHAMIHIPRRSAPSETLLHVQASVQRMGALCDDMYIVALNVTGRWATHDRQCSFHSGGGGAIGGSSKWLRFGKVDLKVAHGRTSTGKQYLNLLVRNLKNTGYDVGGLLGMDDHTWEATPTAMCRTIMTL